MKNDQGDGGLLDPAAFGTVQAIAARAGPGTLEELVRSFLSDAEAHLATIEQGLRAGDDEAVLRAAHALDGSGRVMGARALADACRRIYHVGGEGLTPAAAVEAARLPAELERVRRALEAALRDLPPGS